jgi:hypothetical protein
MAISRSKNSALTCSPGYTGGGQLTCANGILTPYLGATSACCFHTVVVSGAESVQLTRMGSFTLTGTANGRTLYQNTEQQYLYYWSDSGTWKIGSSFDAASGGVQSSSGRSSCPHTATSWRSYHDNAWNTSPFMTVTCDSAAAAGTSAYMEEGGHSLTGLAITAQL